jgi:hypothetical protein
MRSAPPTTISNTAAASASSSSAPDTAAPGPRHRPGLGGEDGGGRAGGRVRG